MEVTDQIKKFMRTQVEVAKELDINAVYLNQIINGKTPSEKIQRKTSEWVEKQKKEFIG